MSQDKQEMTVQDRASEFVPVEGGSEGSSAAGLLTAAYIAMWFIVFAFIWMTAKRLKSVQNRVDELESSLKKADAASASGS